MPLSFFLFLFIIQNQNRKESKMGFFEKLLNTIRPTNSLNLKLEVKEDISSLTVPKGNIKYSAQKIANLVSNSFNSREAAIQFVLEELDIAQNGNTRERMFVINSGVNHNLYNDSIANFNQKNNVQLEEVDDACKQLSDLLDILKGSKSFKIQFRLATVDQIMRKYNIGKYELMESHENTTAATKDA